jgi:hypothetical protein
MTDEKTLAQKLSDVMAEVGYVRKDATNAFHKYKYASAEAVLKKVNAALSSRGVAVGSLATVAHYEKGHAVVRLRLEFHDGNAVIAVEGLGEGSDKGDKAIMKANTAALKYALANAFMISWGDDPEQDESTDYTAAIRGADSPEALEKVRAVLSEAAATRSFSKRETADLRSALATRQKELGRA